MTRAMVAALIRLRNSDRSDARVRAANL